MKKQKYYSTAQIVDIAVTIEQKGQEFYKELLDRFDDPQIQKILKQLSEEEVNHEELFSKLRDEISASEDDNAIDSSQSEFLEALADSHLFLNQEKLAERSKDIETALDAIEMAIEFEKDSVVFFSGIKDFVLNDSNGVVEKLAKEEMLHVVKLLDLKKELLLS